jgi:hypothetical protein
VADLTWMCLRNTTCRQKQTIWPSYKTNRHVRPAFFKNILYSAQKNDYSKSTIRTGLTSSVKEIIDILSFGQIFLTLKPKIVWKIILQYICNIYMNDFKISIKNKGYLSLFKKILPEKNRQINEDNFDKRKMFCEKCFWGCVSSRKSRIEKEK